MTDESRLDDLLDQWEEAREAGQEISLEEICGDCPGLLEPLRQRIARLQSIDERMQAAPEPVVTEPHWQKATRIGRYKLLQKLGEGGMGEVWMADQLEPVSRRVALKIIKAGREASKEVVARFEAERQALALMDHPNIARVFDGGTTEDGHPFFVMELVQGIPITEFCDQQRLTPEERLRLFLPVCQAVQHAHQKAIIHRDIKPSNVLVALYDGQPVPKVIDFGLAKAVDMRQKLTDKTVFTEFGQVLGTVLYMSPEQAEVNQLDIDTRTDIYSLGVLLYELLTGTTPIERSTLQERKVLQVLKLLQESDPPRPSRRLSTSNEQAATVSSQRKIDLPRLIRMLESDLDWVVMKALEKDRTRRYETANSFAEDIQRYLDSEPVLAKPPSPVYRLRKFVGKHRGWVAAVTAVAAALIFGIAGIGWFALEANRQAIRARGAELAAEQKAAEATAAAKRANDVLEIVSGSFQSANPYSDQTGEASTSAKDVLLMAKKSMEGSELDSQTRAQLLVVLSQSFNGLGDYAIAEETAKQACRLLRDGSGRDASSLVEAMDQLAVVLTNAGNFNSAIKLHKESLQEAKNLLGDDSPVTLRIGVNLAVAYQRAGEWKDARQQYEQTLASAAEVLPVSDPIQLAGQTGLALTLQLLGQIKDVLPLLEDLQPLYQETYGESHPKTLESAEHLGLAYQAAGRHEEAVGTLTTVLQQREATLGSDHPGTLVATHNLAQALVPSGSVQQAAGLLQESVPKMEKVLLPQHPQTLSAKVTLASLHTWQGEYSKALALLEPTIEALERVLGTGDYRTLAAKGNLGHIYYRLPDRIADAVEMFEELVEESVKKYGPSHPETLVIQGNLAAAYRRMGNLDEAVRLYRKTWNGRRETDGPEHTSTLGVMKGLGITLVRNEQYAEAEKVLRERLEIGQRKYPNGWATFETMSYLGKALTGLGTYDEARPLLIEGYEGLKERAESIYAAQRVEMLSAAIQGIIQLEQQQGRDAVVATWQSELEQLEEMAPTASSE